MAHLHSFHKKESPGLFHTVGEKIKQGAEIAAAVKTIWSVAKPVLEGVRAAAPIVAGLL